jgi:hypothetical protein
VAQRFLWLAGRAGGAAVIALAVTVLGGCGGNGPPSAGGGGHTTPTPASPSADGSASPSGGHSSSDGAAGRSPYAATTCAQWTTKLSEPQRKAAARTLLGRERQRDGATGTPPSRLVVIFERDVTQACAGDRKSTIADTADAVYQIAHKDFAPAK